MESFQLKNEHMYTTYRILEHRGTLCNHCIVLNQMYLQQNLELMLNSKAIQMLIFQDIWNRSEFNI